MKKLFFFILCGFTIISGRSQQKLNETSRSLTGSLHGKVVDGANGNPLYSANVFIHDIKIGAITANDGSYHTSSVPSGKYIVEVSFVGYKSVSENILIDGNVEHDFKLEENFTEASEVVVTGVSKATQIKRNPVPVVSITQEYLKSNLNTNIIDAISKIPGIRGVTTGPNVSKPFIRGLGFN